MFDLAVLSRDNSSWRRAHENTDYPDQGPAVGGTEVRGWGWNADPDDECRRCYERCRQPAGDPGGPADGCAGCEYAAQDGGGNQIPRDKDVTLVRGRAGVLVRTEVPGEEDGQRRGLRHERSDLRAP